MTSTEVGPRTKRRSSVTKWWLILVAALAVTVAVTTWQIADSASYSGYLDPRNADPEGAQAVAEVLADEGVDVEIVRSADELDSADVDGATIVAGSTEYLGDDTTDRLLDRADGAAQLVVIDPPVGVARRLGVVRGATTSPTDPIAAECAAFDGLTIDVESGAPVIGGSEACFPVSDGPLLSGDDRVTVLGAGGLLSNREILRADNAAVALRLLGQEDRLVWYVANPADLDGSEGATLSTLLPSWVRPVTWLTGCVLVAVMLWRGRRLGPLVSEPLPVVVKAIESTLARGRLYRRGRDRSHAARVLRTAARRRAAIRLGLPESAPVDVLLPTLAHETGRPTRELAALLDPAAPAPASDADLVALARQLESLTGADPRSSTGGGFDTRPRPSAALNHRTQSRSSSAGSDPRWSSAREEPAGEPSRWSSAREERAGVSRPPPDQDRNHEDAPSPDDPDQKGDIR